MNFSRNQIQLFSLIAVSMLAHITLGGGRVSASLYMLHHGQSEAMAGIAYSGYSLLPALLSLMMGRWIDKVGPRHVMRTSQVIMIAGLIGPALWPGLYTVLLASVVCGFGFASYMLAANVAVSIMHFEQEGERVGMLGWLAMGNSVAAVGGPAVAGFVIDRGGFGAAYATMAGIVVCSLVASFLVDVPGGVGGRRNPKDGGASVVRMVFSDSRLLRIYLLAMVFSMTYDGFGFMTPVLGHERGFSATTIGMIMSAYATGTFAVRALLPWLARRVVEWRMMTMSFVTTAIVFCLLPLISNGYLHATLGFALGLAAGIGQPTILSLVYRAMPDKAGEGAGLRAMMGNSVGLTAPSIYGAISGAFGAVPVFLGIGCVTVVACWQSQLGYRLSRMAERVRVG
jgi:MFS family permease